MTAKPRLKKSLWTFSSLFLGLTGYAADGSPIIHVESLDPNLDVSSLQQPGVEAHPYEAPKSELPSRAHREKVLRRAGLSDDVRNLDELDRDLLFTRAKRLKLAELAKKYPKIPPKRLALLSKLARQNAGDGQ